MFVKQDAYLISSLEIAIRLSNQFLRIYNPKNPGSDQRLPQYYHKLGAQTKMRNYREETDSEMDIWVFLTPDPEQDKLLSVQMTPFRKICDPQDHFYRACEKKNRYKKIWVK